jgi:two-component system, cell cycle sensor histidine kinase and response regulator CckA
MAPFNLAKPLASRSALPQYNEVAFRFQNPMKDETPNNRQQSDGERTLREDERRLATLLSNLPGMVYRCKNDRNWTMEFVSDGCKALTGYSATALVGIGARTYSSLIHPEDRDRIWNEVQEALRQGIPFRLTYRIHAANGREKWVWEQGVGVGSGAALALEGFITDITELKEAESKYRNIFDGALEGLYRTTLQGRSLAANPALARMLGYGSAQEFITAVTDTTHQLWVDPDERSRCLQLLEAHGVVRGFESQFKRKDGTAVWVSINLRKISGSDERGAYYEGFIENITEHKEAEQKLKTSESKFRAAFMTGADAFSIATLKDGLILDVNGRFTDVFGYSADEACGSTSTQLGLYANFDRGRLLSELREKGYVRDLEFAARRKNGEIRSVLISVNVLKGEGEELILHVVRDITEQKRAEMGMRNLITAIEQSAETIVITDLEGRIQYCNPAFEKITGYSKEEAIGQNPRILKSGLHSAEFYGQLWATIKKGEVWTGHLTNKKKDGSVYEEDATISPIRDASGQVSGFVAVKRDVTERLQLESQLRQAQKLESIGRLAGGVAHDFNNLLTVINGYAEVLLADLDRTDPLWSSIDEIRKAGDRAAGLTKQLLAFSRKQIIEPKALDLNSTIRESERMLQRLIGEDIVLAAELDPLLGPVMADPEQVHQVIMNLVVNARDAMPDGGRLEIGTANFEVTSADASIHEDAKPGRYVVMSVTDSGAGMDEQTRQHIFEPFFTTKAGDKGTGLGLSTVYGIMRQSGGWIDVASKVGAGTSFKLYFPPD